jgi:serine/threonine protein kinase
VPARNDVLPDNALIDDRYRIVRQIGEGAMGLVYEAENLRISRRVAIKVIHPSLASRTDLLQRFEREARAAARVESAHVADVLDLGALPSGERYIVMEYLDGESLQERFRVKRTLTPLELFPIITQLLDGLASVHEAGIIHRDLKPANVFLCRTQPGDFVKILDLGVCKLYELGEEGMNSSGSQIVGTPGYMAPEQLSGGIVDARSDVYSVGVMLYRGLSGKMPYSATALRELVMSIFNNEARPLAEVAPSLDAGVAAIVTKAMNADPDSRYPSASALKASFVEWHNRSKIVERALADYLERPSLLSIATPPAITAPRATKAAPVDLPGPRESLTDVWTPPLEDAKTEPEESIVTVPRPIEDTILDDARSAAARAALPPIAAPRRSSAGVLLLSISVALLTLALVIYWLEVRRH